MSNIKGIYLITGVSLKGIPHRLGSSCVIVIGIAGVVGVLVAVLSMARGFSEAQMGTGHQDRAIVLRTGSGAEIASVIGIESARSIMDKPGVAHDRDGVAIASTDLVRGLNLVRKTDGAKGGVTLRGVSAGAFAVRPEIRLVEGRQFTRGLRELIVGRGAKNEFAGLNVGDTVKLRSAHWRIVGEFVSGDAFESSLMTDVDVLMSSLQRTGASSVTVLLESESAYSSFADAVTTDPSLSVEVFRERDYYAQQSLQLRTLMNAVAYFVGGIMAIGAVFAALNAMYSTVSARTVEIATLRAIGFEPTAIVISVLAEAVSLALLGAVIGACFTWLLFDGSTTSTGDAVSSAVFQLKVTASLVAIGVGVACGVGVVGGFLPAIRAATQPIATALRSV